MLSINNSGPVPCPEEPMTPGAASNRLPLAQPAVAAGFDRMKRTRVSGPPGNGRRLAPALLVQWD